MARFNPYHVGIATLTGLAHPDHLADVLRVGAYAELAKVTIVPKEHRASVAEVFARQARTIRENKLPDGAESWAEINWVLASCDAVSDAMRFQDQEDAAKAEQAQQQQ